MASIRSVPKNSIYKIILGLFLTLAFISFQGCKVADLRTKKIDYDSPNREPKAITLLDKAIENQSFETLSSSKTYTFDAINTWKGINALFNPFPRTNKLMRMTFRPNTFDSQFYYIEDKDSIKYGIQSFKYYIKHPRKNIRFKNKKSMIFTLPAMQYLFELPLRIREAPILKYAGKMTFEGDVYDLVFATWKSIEPNSEHDQYLLYISEKTGLLTYACYTVRASYLPIPKNIFASIRYEDLQENKDGIKYFSTLIIQVNKLKKRNRWSQKTFISNLDLNVLDDSALYPDQTLKFLGDSKN